MSDKHVEIQAIPEDVERLCRERPFTVEFVKPYAGLLEARALLVESLLEETRNQPDGDHDVVRLGTGVPLEPRDAFPLDQAKLQRAFDVIQPALVDNFLVVRADLLNIGSAVSSKEGLLVDLVKDMLGDRQQFLIRTGYSLGVDARVLGFWCIQLLTPLAMVRGRFLAPLVPEGVWNRGYCPVCGSWPSMSHQDDTGRQLTCSFCATTWSYTRPECPLCGAEDSAVAIAMPGNTTERLVACQNCNHFIGEIIGEPFPGMRKEVECLAVTPLELMARQQGQQPANLDWRQMLWMQ